MKKYTIQRKRTDQFGREQWLFIKDCPVFNDASTCASYAAKHYKLNSGKARVIEC